MIGVVATEANTFGRLGAVVALAQEEKLSRLDVVWVDQRYSDSKFKRAVQAICGDTTQVEVIERESETFDVAEVLDY